MIWWIALVAGGLFVVAVVAVACVVVGSQSHERRGVIRFDTPHGRSALRRCNPARDVHYFGLVDRDARCECGAHTVPLGDDAA